MPTIGVFFSTEELSAPQILDAAPKAEAAGFRKAWISDHFHPWNNEQGNSPFVWSVLGALAQATDELHFTTAVTCPTVRIHPALVAQAAATVTTLMPGRFALGVGTGEALNEHIFGDQWPSADLRMEMLEEAIEVIRMLWEGGTKDHDGRHYHLENARIYSLPETPPDVLVSGLGPKATSLAARIGDGYINVAPDADAVKQYRDEGGRGPTQMGMKVCLGPDKDECLKTAYRLWPNEALPGELITLLPTPRHFEQACELVTEELIADAITHGPDAQEVIETIQEGVEAGFDEIYVSQIGPDQEFFLDLMEKEVLPHFA